MSTYCYGLESFFQQFGFLHSTNQKETSSEGKQNETISKKPPGGATKKSWGDLIQFQSRKRQNFWLVGRVPEQMSRSVQTDTCNEGVEKRQTRRVLAWVDWQVGTVEHKLFSFRSCQLFVLMCSVSMPLLL